MKILALTPLRFIAALIVVIFHFGKDLTFLPDTCFQGPEMVTFFFVLSGFVLTVAYNERPDIEFSEFILNRIARIAPVYLLALGLVAAGKLVRGELNLLDALLSSLFLQSWVPSHALALNGPGWSLSVEMFFYVLFPFVFFWISQSRHSALSLLVLAFILWLSTQLVNAAIISTYGQQNLWPVYFPPLHLASFILGIAGGRLLVDGSCNINRLKGRTALVFSTCLCILVLESSDDISDLAPYIQTAGSFLSPIFLYFILCVAVNNDELRWLHNRVLVTLGEASFGLYILQVPINSLLKYSILPYFSGNVAAFTFYCIALIGCAILVHFFFEAPANKLLRRLFRDIRRKKQRKIFELL